MVPRFLKHTQPFVLVVTFIALFGIAFLYSWPGDITGATPIGKTCIAPPNGMSIHESTVFCGGRYSLAEGLMVEGDNIILDCDGAVLTGAGEGYGVLLRGNNNHVKDCIVEHYHYGTYIEGQDNSLEGLTLRNNDYGVFAKKQIKAYVYSTTFDHNQQDILDEGGNMFSNNIFLA